MKKTSYYLLLSSTRQFFDVFDGVGADEEGEFTQCRIEQRGLLDVDPPSFRRSRKLIKCLTAIVRTGDGE
jgi:hypothetical protein